MASLLPPERDLLIRRDALSFGPPGNLCAVPAARDLDLQVETVLRESGV